MRDFLFGDWVGRWKGKNPLLFAVAAVTPAGLVILFSSAVSASTIVWVVGIVVAVAVMLYVPIKIQYWLEDRRRH